MSKSYISIMKKSCISITEPSSGKVVSLMASCFPAYDSLRFSVLCLRNLHVFAKLIRLGITVVTASETLVFIAGYGEFFPVSLSYFGTEKHSSVCWQRYSRVPQWTQVSSQISNLKAIHVVKLGKKWLKTDWKSTTNTEKPCRIWLVHSRLNCPFQLRLISNKRTNPWPFCKATHSCSLVNARLHIYLIFRSPEDTQFSPESYSIIDIITFCIRWVQFSIFFFHEHLVWNSLGLLFLRSLI